MARSNNHNHKVPVDQLRWHCNPKSLGIETTADVTPTKEIIGQERALRALRLGLELKHPGYNVFVTGFSGTGRLTTIKRLLSEFVMKDLSLPDHCYVHNFKNGDQPTLITLPAGQGKKFRDDMESLVREFIKDIPAAFDRKRFKEERKRMMEHFQERQRSVLKDFEAKVKEKGFEVIQVQVGNAMRPDITPVVNNQPVGFDQLDGLLKQGQVTKEQIESMMKERAQLEGQMDLVLRELRNIERKAKDSLDDLEGRYILPIIKERLDEIRSKYTNEKLLRYLDEVQENIMDNLGRFRTQEESPAMMGPSMMMQQEEDTYTEFLVNVLVDNSDTKGVPIIIETNPRFKNIFGTIDREIDRNGVWRTDFSLIKPGSLVQADGGFLVINALDALVEQGVWQTLKRTLRHGLLEIQTLETGMFGATSALKPESIKLNVKVILLGDAHVYYTLYEQDDDFKKIFKVRADFDTEMPKAPQSIKKYVNFITMVCEEENLRPFDAKAISAVIEYGVRLASSQKKLSTRFNIVADVAREANYWASNEEVPTVTGKHIWKAIDERVERSKLAEEKMREMIEEGVVMLDLEGSSVGQANGLTVFDMREYAFGLPARITAQTSMGRKGLINIEREVSLSGPNHDKGVLIISGYMHGMYAKNKPLTMNASIAFEQSYGMIEGDSASSTEVYTILSSLANVPLRQDIGITGSVNQKGEIQPIGGANQKIEGFYRSCKLRGLTGTQGVIIPEQNKKDLMLRQDVVDAVADEKFHVYAISTIDEGIEILTGMKAGKRLKNGGFEIGSLHYLVDTTLTEYSRRWKELL